MGLSISILYILGVILINIYALYLLVKIIKKRRVSYMECPYCGASVKADDITCSQCGQNISSQNIKVPVGTKRKHQIKENLKDKLGREPTQAEIDKGMWGGD